MQKNLCFVLGAGGARGIAHVGFLQAMEENGIIPDCIVGCSMGSVVGGCYAAGITPSKMKEVADSLKKNDIIDVAPNFISKKGLLKSMKMQLKLEKLLGSVTFDALKIPFECVAVDLITGKPVTLNEGMVEESVRASSSIPLVFRPVIKNGMELVDGATLVRVPVANARHFNAKVVVAVDVLGRVVPKEIPTKNIIDLALRAVDINDAHHTRNYLKAHKPDLLIEPELEDMSQYKIDRLSFAYEQGYIAGIENVERIKALIEEKCK
ncbi:MAG: patatin-like phospholipase family protein [Clostridia bacterium]|nr:patatin-like phospholipase family protein [Clostridia bacterium]